MSDESFPTADSGLLDQDVTAGSAPDLPWEEGTPEQDYSGGWPGLAADEPLPGPDSGSLWTEAQTAETKLDSLPDWIDVVGSDEPDGLGGQDSTPYLLFDDSFLW